MRRFCLYLLLLGSLIFSTFAELRGEKSLEFQSPDEEAHVLELFTSQGCSSCPSAERWVSQFMDHPGLWTEIVPIVFHVDYWDRLGWKDPFASKDNTNRQYSYSRSGDIRQVYTPCFVSNGNEWRGYFDQGSLPRYKEKLGVLKGTLIKERLAVSFNNPKEDLDLHVLVLGCDLQTKVRSGENRGKLLKQQFVSLAHETHKANDNDWKIRVPDFDKKEGARYALALFVTKRGLQTPIQATGTWLAME
jgi:hypothetical protein